MPLGNALNLIRKMDNFKNSKILDSEDLASRLKLGSPALFPTDTVPALSTIPPKAFKLWKLKKRSLDKPLILMGATPGELFENILPQALKDANQIARKYWPGQITMVLPAEGPILEFLNPGGTKLGLRVPESELARDLLAKSGPLATSSANLSGLSTSLSAEEAMGFFPSIPLLGPLPWPQGSNSPSTIISWQSIGSWKVLRKGVVNPENL